MTVVCGGNGTSCGPHPSCGMAGKLGKKNVPITNGSHDMEAAKYGDSDFALCLDGLPNAYGAR